MNDKLLKKYLKTLEKSEYFDKEYYSNKYNVDITDCVRHYYFEGWKKGYDPSLRFSSSKYLKKNDKVQICPLLDWELYNWENNRELVATDVIYEGVFFTKKIRRGIKRFISNVINLPKIIKNKNKKILVCLHIFYYYCFDEIKEYLKNLDSYNYELIVSITENCYNEELVKKIIEYKPNAKILKYPNRGYDIGSFVDIVGKTDLNKYDAIIKLQSKGTKIQTRYVYNQLFKNREWFINLYEGVIGAFKVHKTIDFICNKKDVGLVAAKNLIVEDPPHKRNLLKSSLTEMNIKCIEDYKYVAGTCFAIKPELLKPLKKLNLTIKDFNLTRRGTFSLAHILERYMCFEVTRKGLSFYGNSVCLYNKLKWKKANKKLYSLSGMRLTEDNRFKLSDDFVYYFIEGFFIDEYSVEYMYLRDIRREWNGKIIKLNQCAPYKYLNGNKKEYLEYCEYHQKNNLPYMTVKRYEELIKNIEKNGYNDEYPIIIKKEDKTIMDGQHRSCYLLKKYGEGYKVRVVKIKNKFINLQNIKPFSDKI